MKYIIILVGLILCSCNDSNIVTGTKEDCKISQDVNCNYRVNGYYTDFYGDKCSILNECSYTFSPVGDIQTPAGTHRYLCNKENFSCPDYKGYNGGTVTAIYDNGVTRKITPFYPDVVTYHPVAEDTNITVECDSLSEKCYLIHLDKISNEECWYPGDCYQNKNGFKVCDLNILQGWDSVTTINGKNYYHGCDQWCEKTDSLSDSITRFFWTDEDCDKK